MIRITKLKKCCSRVSCLLSLSELDIWLRLIRSSTPSRDFAGNDHLKTRLFETYRREYENFMKLDGETLDTMFSQF
jgi:hypothetical protein